MTRPSNIRKDHYGSQELAAKRLSYPQGYGTGTEVVLTADWTPNKKQPTAYRVSKITNGVCNGNYTEFKTLAEAKKCFDEDYTACE